MVSPILLEEKDMAKRTSGARCVSTRCRNFTSGASREFEKMMKETSKMVYRPAMSSNAKVFTKMPTPAKG